MNLASLLVRWTIVIVTLMENAKSVVAVCCYYWPSTYPCDDTTCNCNDYSLECTFDKDLYEQTGHGGHCLNCSGNRDGPNCERCKENYYQRYDNYCIACECNIQGSRSLQCNSNGKCQCKTGVIGEKCDRCAPNYYQFSAQGCKPCRCSEEGSYGNEPNCNSETGVCSCKENVEGKMCRECKPGYFNLNSENEFGCTPCFCYGHSAKCHSAPGYAKHLLETNFNRNQEKWNAQDESGRSTKLLYNDKTKSIVIGPKNNEDIYFIAPIKYLGDQRASYNHDLKFTFYINESTTHSSSHDIFLESSDLKVSIPIFGQQNYRPSKQKNEFIYRLHEDQKYEWSPKLTTRQFMSILSDLKSIRIRGTYNRNGVGILENFKLETASAAMTGPPAMWVETCSCPTGYIGQFCESCAPRYRHNPALGGPFKPCVPCDCNKHADICDSDSGSCICKHNTMGLNCELCAKGFYGTATFGTPNDCKECPCPNKSACIQLGDDIVCTECPVGYAGKKCEVCSDGYFGDPSPDNGPEIPCKLCECNNNIDTNAVANCNSTTGHCLKCIYNTAGSNCEQCLPGFYGDALGPIKGDCRQCECYRLGTDQDEFGIAQCDSLSGQCFCKNHVQGRNCDKCQEGYFNIESGDGCQACNCNSEGSLNNTCDLMTGQCHCKVGITGLQCDQCKSEHYGFSKDGCKECMCDSIGSRGPQCDAKGQCPCYENVEGLHCDMCKENKYDRQRGCIDCHNCYNLVQDAVRIHREKLLDLEKMLIGIEKSPTVISDDLEFDKNLAEVREKIDNLLQQANKLTDENNTGKTISQRLDDFSAHLQNISKEMENINASIESAKKSEKEGSKIIENAKEIIGSSQSEAESALEYLQQNGQSALKKAQNRSEQYGQQSNQMSTIAKESRIVTEKLENEANTIKDIAKTAHDRAFEAYTLTTNGLKQHTNISQELNVLHGLMNNTEQMLNNILEKAKISLNRSRNAYEKAFGLYFQVEKITLPDIDDADIRKNTEMIIIQAEAIQQKIDELKKDNSAMLTDLDNQSNRAQILYNQSMAQQEAIDEIMTNLDQLRSTAQSAINNLDVKYKEAIANNDTLNQFHNKVQTSRTDALDALKLIPKINEKLENISKIQENLDTSQRNSMSAESIALDAKQLAENAITKCNATRGEYYKIAETAQLLHKEAQQLPGRIEDSDALIDDIEKNTKDYQQKVTATKIRVNNVYYDISETESKIKKSLDNINMILTDLNNLPNLNDDDLDSLEHRLKEAESDQLKANLTEQIRKLQTSRKIHQNWLKDYEDEIKTLEIEVEGVRNISEALPDGCFKNLKLEP